MDHVQEIYIESGISCAINVIPQEMIFKYMIFFNICNLNGFTKFDLIRNNNTTARVFGKKMNDSKKYEGVNKHLDEFTFMDDKDRSSNKTDYFYRLLTTNYRLPTTEY